MHVPEDIFFGGSKGAAGSLGMLRHLFQKGAKVEKGCPFSSFTSHGS
jgi:hypothetical protein